MIDQKELHIGCWYNFKNPMSGDLIPMLFQTWADALDFEAYAEGISITPEWLEKLGFEINNWYDGGQLIYSGWHLEDFLIDDEYRLDGAISESFQYVHKLQAAYRVLKNKELTIKSFNQSN